MGGAHDADGLQSTGQMLHAFRANHAAYPRKQKKNCEPKAQTQQQSLSPKPKEKTQTPVVKPQALYTRQSAFFPSLFRWVNHYTLTRSMTVFVMFSLQHMLKEKCLSAFRKLQRKIEIFAWNPAIDQNLQRINDLGHFRHKANYTLTGNVFKITSKFVKK